MLSWAKTIALQAQKHFSQCVFFCKAFFQACKAGVFAFRGIATMQWEWQVV